AALTPHPFAVAVVCYSLPPRASTLFPYTTLFRSGGPCERRIGPLEEALPVGEDRGLAAQRRAAVDEDRLVVDEGGEGLEVPLGHGAGKGRLGRGQRAGIGRRRRGRRGVRAVPMRPVRMPAP